MNYGAFIKNNREKMGMSYRALSKASGVPTTTIFHCENGAKTTVDTVDRLLKALGVSLVVGVPESAELTRLTAELERVKEERDAIHDSHAKLSEAYHDCGGCGHLQNGTCTQDYKIQYRAGCWQWRGTTASRTNEGEEGLG